MRKAPNQTLTLSSQITSLHGLTDSWNGIPTCHTHIWASLTAVPNCLPLAQPQLHAGLLNYILLSCPNTPFWHFAGLRPCASVSALNAWTNLATLPSSDKPETGFGQLEGLISKWEASPKSQEFTVTLFLRVTKELYSLITSRSCKWLLFPWGCKLCLPTNSSHTIILTHARTYGAEWGSRGPPRDRHSENKPTASSAVTNS